MPSAACFYQAIIIVGCMPYLALSSATVRSLRSASSATLALDSAEHHFRLRVVAADIANYRRSQADHLSRVKSVQNVKTDVPSQTLKQSSELPL